VLAVVEAAVLGDVGEDELEAERDLAQALDDVVGLRVVRLLDRARCC
jgi:hypothetical protein